MVLVTHSTTESVYLSTRVVGMAACPGRLIGSVDVPAQYPRGKEFRMDLAFFNLSNSVAEMLIASGESG